MFKPFFMQAFFQKQWLRLAYGVPRPAEGAFSAAAIRKALIIRRNGIGDMICALPLMRSLRAAWPEVQLDVVAGEENACLLDGLDLARHVYIHHRGSGLFRIHHFNLARFLQPIRAENYDLVIAVKAGFSSLLARLAYATGIPWRLGYVPSRGHPLDFCFNLRVELPREREHQIDSCLRFLEPLGISGASRDLSIRPSLAHERYADEILARLGLKAGNFALCNVSAKRPESRWTADAIAQTARGLKKLFDLPTILCGVRSDQAFLQATRQQAPDAIAEAVEPPTILHFAALTARARFLLCGDGAPMHIAAGVNTPVFVLFSATDPRIWGPRGVPVAHLLCRRAVADISPSEVLARLETWLPGLPFRKRTEKGDKIL